MTTYRVADTFNVALGSLTVLSPQPRSEGVKAARRTFGGDGSIYQESAYVELEWDVIGTVTEYQALLTAFGVNAALTNEVTVYVRDETFAFVRMNGIACRPEIGRDVRYRQYFARDVVILIKDLAAAS